MRCVALQVPRATQVWRDRRGALERAGVATSSTRSIGTRSRWFSPYDLSVVSLFKSGPRRRALNTRAGYVSSNVHKNLRASEPKSSPGFPQKLCITLCCFHREAAIGRSLPPPRAKRCESDAGTRRDHVSVRPAWFNCAAGSSQKEGARSSALKSSAISEGAPY